VRGESVRIKPYQIIVWLSIGQPDERDLRPQALRFPAILDLGHSHNFSITEDHLTRWAGLGPHDLETIGAVRVAGQRLPLLDANVWLHSNRSGERDEFANRQPFCIQLDSGISIYPAGVLNAVERRKFLRERPSSTIYFLLSTALFWPRCGQKWRRRESNARAIPTFDRTAFVASSTARVGSLGPLRLSGLHQRSVMSTIDRSPHAPREVP
jgi:hypothetical protein